MLGQTVFYTLSDVDRGLLGALRQQVRAAIVTENPGDGTVSLHVFVPNPARPVIVRNGVPAGDPGQPGTWNGGTPRVAGSGAVLRRPAPSRLTRTGSRSPSPLLASPRWRNGAGTRRRCSARRVRHH